ncbi:regulator of nonsense transcripts 1 isoform X2 [Trypanosoma conorhini]|uniref:Regulator of nonsense transcripts 1 isoform X2 n=1 Tax=Trypanosoma conorhini TaxID=83891 RepID=A0A3R7M7N2_9TRYP|nr:regulator of nonsense transcripts 1 isoform X2 [Trypanosoma conorhini]RNF10537.1 regulator of nonsense transcripts 1 isoform X2 [Trypanosoma conorhini]
MSQSTATESPPADSHCVAAGDKSEDPDAPGSAGPTRTEVSCSYCGEDDPRSLAICTVCKKWFCNGGHGTSGSHIVLHLVRNKHRAVQLHAENPLGDPVLECYICRSTNIFSLGFMPSKEESVVVLVCREPCLHSKALRDLNWDASTWLPVIEERRVLPWICKVPTFPRKKLTLHEITTLELAWNSEEKQTVDVLEDAPAVPLRFENAVEYMTVFKTLVEMDFVAAREQRDLLFENVACKFQKEAGGKHLFLLKQLPPSEVGLRCGDQVSLWAKEGWRLLKGVIVELGRSQLGDEEAVFEACCSGLAEERKALSEILAASTVSFRIEYDATSCRRVCQALERLAQNAALSAYLYFTILGREEEAASRFAELDVDLPPQRLPGLNASQDSAARTALRSPLTLIQGPPGTGKTATSVAIVIELNRHISSQILVCAPSNVAADHLAERISAAGLKTVRLYARDREVPSSLRHVGLDGQVEEFIMASSGNVRLKQMLEMKLAGEVLSDREQAVYTDAVRKVEEALLGSADVICCTCIGAADRRLGKMRFQYVLIDEATQATEPEALVPLVRGAKQVFLVGDHCQLRPVVFSLPAEKAGLRRSLFERLLLTGHRAVRLEVQYRMHPSLSLFPSGQFYEGTLQNGVTAAQRDASRVFPWPDPTNPIFFYNTTGSEELGENGSSYLNRAEGALTERIITKLIRDGKVKPEDIGVITPYRSQCRFVTNYLARCGPLPREVYERVEVSSVDAFQGREKEFIILSCVRSNRRQGIGFVVDWRRLNVSITRAKRGLFIMGNVQLLSRYPAWHALIAHLMELALVVDGPIEELVPSMVVLHKPRCTSEEQ